MVLFEANDYNATEEKDARVQMAESFCFVLGDKKEACRDVSEERT